MTLREIFGSIIDFDLAPLFEFVGGAIVMVGLPIGLIWFGYMLLKDVFINEQPHDRDLFAKIFIVISGLFAWGLAIFVLYYFVYRGFILLN